MIPSSLVISASHALPQGAGRHDLHALLWRAEIKSDATPLFCVHGLTRNSWDFDVVARSLSMTTRVIAPDMAGRGASDRLPAALYNYGTYIADCIALLDRLKLEQVDWLGTSMGGLIGMMMAQAAPGRIRKLILNDVGPLLSLSALKRIADYVGKPQRFANLAEAERYCRATYADFGIRGADDWRRFTLESVTETDGGYTMNYDVGIAQIFGTVTQDVDLWAIYDMLRCPTLVLRGERSDVLSAEVADAMTTRGPKAKLVTFKNCGHAPALVDAEQIAAVKGFLAV